MEEKIPKKLRPEMTKSAETPVTPKTPEEIPTPERAVEQLPEQMPAEKEGARVPEQTEGATAQAVLPPGSDEHSVRIRQIENILSDGLEEAYLSMGSSEKRQFKEKGEETARQVQQLLEATKVKVKKIVTLISEWLKLIPGINGYFLEQEAKIKTDRLLKLGGDAEKTEYKNKI